MVNNATVLLPDYFLNLTFLLAFEDDKFMDLFVSVACHYFMPGGRKS